LKLKLGEKVIINLEGERIIIQRISEDIWDNCHDFLPDNFEKIMANSRDDAVKRFKKKIRYHKMKILIDTSIFSFNYILVI